MAQSKTALQRICFSAGEQMSLEQSQMQQADADRQWIFPSIRFTCTAIVTGWIFTDTSDDVTCPTMELWIDVLATPTDYRRSVIPIAENYTELISVCLQMYSAHPPGCPC
jgi:hypothetical protein